MADRPPVLPPREASAEPTGGLGDLLADLVRDVTGIVRGEGRLIRTEIASAASGVAVGLERLAVGALVLLLAAIVLVQALIVVLAGWVGPGWASLIVGLCLAVIGGMLVVAGRKRLTTSELMPDRTLQQTSRDVRLAKEHL